MAVIKSAITNSSHYIGMIIECNSTWDSDIDTVGIVVGVPVSDFDGSRCHQLQSRMPRRWLAAGVPAGAGKG